MEDSLLAPAAADEGGTGEAPGGGTPPLHDEAVGVGFPDPLSAADALAADALDMVAPDAEPLDPSVVQGWLVRARPAAVLALLKDPDCGFAVSRVFLGFRPDAKGYANPLVRTRLVQAAVKDAALADKLREIAEADPAPPVAAKAVPTPVVAGPQAAAQPDMTAALRAERDARRRERDQARQALAAAEAERDQARKSQQAAEAERDEAARQLKRQAERIARLDRQVARMRLAETRLLKALGEDKVSPPPSSPARSARPGLSEAPSAASPWLSAVQRLLDRGKLDQALALAEDVLKSEAEEGDALEIAARALEGKPNPRAALPFLRRLLAVQIARREVPAAAGTLLRLLRQTTRPEEAEGDARLFLAALAPSDTAGVEAGRLLLTRLRGADPVAHGWLANVIAAQTTLGPVLMPPPGALGPDDALPLPLVPGQPATARAVADAVDRGAPLVDAVRDALASLDAADPATAARVWTALEQAASDDPLRLTPLRRTPRGPVVVDGSNVAWFDQESLVHGKPRLRHLYAVRRALWARGFFPVVLYADANLPYFIDEPLGLRALRDRQELSLVDAGTVADEVLLRQAKYLRAPLVTNDKMDDWDPDREVPKMRYTISLGGEAHILNEI